MNSPDISLQHPDETTIEQLVRAFYARARDDALLGPVFAAQVDDWEAHLQRMFAFWSSVTLNSGRYRGQPMQAHMPLPIEAQHFDRWLALFEATAHATCPDLAAQFIEPARRIAQSLELGVASAHGVLLGTGQRFVRG